MRGAPASRVTAAGNWKLRLENTGTPDTTCVVAAWNDAAAKKF